MKFETAAEADAATCELHNVQGCACCNQVKGECDFGSCRSAATTSVSLFMADGKTVGEIRPCCSTHLDLILQSAIFGHK